MEQPSPRRPRVRSDRRSWLPLLLWLVVPIASQAHSPAASTPVLIAQAGSENGCPQPALSRLTRHKVRTGETLQSVANQYSLVPATLINLNPGLGGGALPVGREILIPPFNGIRVQAPRGSSWQDLAAAYGVRADVLYEVNGCQRQPQLVFIPGANTASGGRPAVDTFTGFATYPLPAVAPIALSYGWHQNPNTGQARFHSGIDLLAAAGTSVRSVDAGTVAFAGEQGDYGILVVVNHQGGRQTRYAHLSRASVATGQLVKAGDPLGTVGSTGRPDTTRPHLHFEVRYSSPQGWVAQDPEPNLKAKPTAQR